MDFSSKLYNFTKFYTNLYFYIALLPLICYNFNVMKILNENNNIILTEVKDFNLQHIFDCGQCFRWEREAKNCYIGVAFGKALKISQDKDTIILYNTTREDFDKIWFNYFDFGTDYQSIKKALSKDAVLCDAVRFGNGIRILNQDLWECVVSFIISQSNNIPRIKKIISTLCELYGEKINYMGKTYYSFPDVNKIHSLSSEELSLIKAGFRDKYIMSAAEFFTNEFSDTYFDSLSYDEAKKELIKIKGIGDKVADCILLFGLSKRSSFPVDVWIKRVVEYFYFNEPQSVGKISEFAAERFSNLGGYAQQYLFYYARENKIGINL